MSSLPVEFSALLPLWIVVAGALCLLLLEAFLKEEGRKAAPVLTGAFLVLALASTFHLLALHGMPGSLFHGAVVVDLYSVTLQGICLLSALLTCVFSGAYLRREKAVTGEYYALILLAAAGMVTLVAASEFLTLFVGLELMSLAGYVLAGYFRVKERSTEAALKYFLLGVFSSAFLLYGIAVLYGISGTTHFPELRLFLEKGNALLAGPQTNSVFVQLGVILLLVGLGFKVALVPFHGWAPDVYDGAASPVSAFLSTGVKAAGFGIFARLFAEVFGLPGTWSLALGFLAVLTMTLGNLGALGQTSLKRLIAYSSVAHAGYLAVGLAAASGAPADQVERAVAFYLLAYTLMTAGVFGWIAWASGPGEAKTGIEDIRGLGWTHPWMGVVLGVLMFSLAGMTPTAGFFGKYYLFKLAVDQNMIALAVIAVLNSFVSAYYYLKVVAALYAKPEGAPAVLLPSSLALYLTFFFCAIGVLVIGFLKFPF
jgi:NADH-quinone oxidoreductase subunit N